MEAGRLRRRLKGEDDIDKAVQSVQESAETPYKLSVPLSWRRVLSTGSTLLDLAISGTRIRGGGVPGGILMEVYGRSSSGKTSILSELCGSAQAKGGETNYLDPEARLDEEHSRIYGHEIDKKNYHKPDTVSEMFDILGKWKPSDANINVIAADSLAALSTNLEMEKGDKMGMRRAKEFSEGMRKYCRFLENKQWLFACSNQLRHGEYGDVTPGGMAIEFYSSLRISVNKIDFIQREKDLNGKKIKRIIGIESKCIVTKSSIDKPYREAPIYIVFDYGIDDVSANLQWFKDMTQGTVYDAIEKTYQARDAAAKYIEKNNLENALRERVIDLWLEIEEKFTQKRKPKMR